jgi:myo-inositol-1(or 4)-monophosphatase
MGPNELLRIAEAAVDGGGRLLREARWHPGAHVPKGDRDYATQVDLRIEAVIKEALVAAAPQVALLGEEGDRPASDAEAMWVLDPIDGTVNFANGSPLCAISLALVQAGEPTIGVIDLPLLDERYVARRDAGATLNRRPLRVFEKPLLREAIVGFSDFAVGAAAKAENPVHAELMGRLVDRCLRIRVHGSECLDLAWLAAGRLDVSVMLSSLPWDVTAGVLIATEAGALAFDQDGSPWSYLSPVTICVTPGLAGELMPIVQEAVEAAASSP